MKELEMVQSSKFLGVILDDRLTWKPHVNQISKKLSTGISFLTKVCSVFPCNILKYIYRSFVECYITYGIESWGSTYKTTLKPVYILQKRAMRIIHNIPPKSSIMEKFSTEGLLTVFQLAFQQLALAMYKITNKIGKSL